MVAEGFTTRLCRTKGHADAVGVELFNGPPEDNGAAHIGLCVFGIGIDYHDVASSEIGLAGREPVGEGQFKSFNGRRLLCCVILNRAKLQTVENSAGLALVGQGFVPFGRKTGTGFGLCAYFAVQVFDLDKSQHPQCVRAVGLGRRLDGVEQPVNLGPLPFVP